LVKCPCSLAIPESAAALSTTSNRLRSLLQIAAFQRSRDGFEIVELSFEFRVPVLDGRWTVELLRANPEPPPGPLKATLVDSK